MWRRQADVSENESRRKIQLPVSVRVCNTGNFDCAETVQVYVKALCDGSPNPQLKGFGKVF